MIKREFQAINEALRARELSFVQKLLFVPVAEDFAAVFTDEFGAVSYDEIAQNTEDMQVLLIPGQAFIRTFKKAFELRYHPEIKAMCEEGGIDINNWKFLLGTGAVGVVMGLAAELNEGWGSKKSSDIPPTVILYPNLILSAAGAAIAPERMLLTIELLTLFKLIVTPYTAFHEMAHSLADPNLKDNYGNRLSETWTDFWAQVVSSKGNSLISHMAHKFASNPLTSFGGWPIQSFDRALMRSFIRSIEKAAEIPERDIIKAMARLYCGRDETLLDLIYDLSNGQEDDVLNLFNQRGRQSKRIKEMETLYKPSTPRVVFSTNGSRRH